MSESPDRIQLTALQGVPAVGPGDDLAALFLEAAQETGVALERGVLVVCQKVVSKAEGRLVPLADVEPSEEALRIAAEDDKDPRQVEVVLRESVRIVRRGHGVIITETKHGFVCANSAVDLSNSTGEDVAVLLPIDPDASAARLLADLEARGARELAVVVTDTFGRPWREGLVDQAIGSAGIQPILDIRGTLDLAGRELLVTANALVDQLAAAAGMLMLKDSGVPAVWVTGVPVAGDGKVADLVRGSENDLFR